jgi:hypothetical protein
MKTRLLAVLLVSSLAIMSIVPTALAQNAGGNRGPDVQYVDCSQVQSAVGGQYGNAIAIGRDAAAEVAQELNITQNQVNACLGTVGQETTEEKTNEETTKGETTKGDGRSGEETTVVDGQTVIIPKGVAAEQLPETGGPTGGGYALAAGCALIGVGLIVNRIVR